MRTPPWIALAAVAALGLGVGLLVREETADAAPVRVTASQLLINQRISQAGVRRSNEALKLLDPIRPATGKKIGWASSNILDGAVTNAKLGSNAVTSSKIADGQVGNADLASSAVSNTKIADAAVTSGKIANGAVAETDLSTAVQAKLVTLFAVVDAATTPSATKLARGSGVTGVARQEAGVYSVSFGQNVTGCAYTATAGDTGSAQAVSPQLTSVSGQAGNPNGVLVRISDLTGSTPPLTPADTDFHLVVTC
jgi:hypothetical protein